MHQILPAVSLQAQSVFFVLVEEEERRLAPTWRACLLQLRFSPEALTEARWPALTDAGSRAAKFHQGCEREHPPFGCLSRCIWKWNASHCGDQGLLPIPSRLLRGKSRDSFPPLSLFMAAPLALNSGHTWEILRVRFRPLQ